MKRSLFRFLLLALLLQYPSYCSAQQTSKWENKNKFKWDSELWTDCQKTYGDSAKFFFRLSQIYCESAFNPLATSDFGGWKVSGLDTAQAILQRKGAAGLTQFIWPTGKSLGAISVNTQQAAVDTFASDVYNPKWSLQACCKYMKSNEILMRTTRNPKSRRKLIANKIFSELCATAGYNTGPGKIRRLLNLSSEWKYIRLKILEEPRLYSEKIIRIAEEMKKANRWKQIPSKY